MEELEASTVIAHGRLSCTTVKVGRAGLVADCRRMSEEAVFGDDGDWRE